MSNANNTLHIPETRFPEFKGEWEEKKLREVAIKVGIRNKNLSITRVLTNSAVEGIVDQCEYFDKDIAVKDNTENYHIVEIDDFVYNPRISSSAPVGPISRNKVGRGVMSPLYTIFRFSKVDTLFMEYYFNTTIWHSYLKSIANFGARFDRMNITTDAFFDMPLLLPSLEEQKKIAECLSSVDESIAAQQEKVDALKAHKKGLMQQLFPQDGETTPRLRFPGFEGEWQVLKIAQLCSVNRGARVTRRDLIDKGKYPVFQNTNIPLGYYNLYNVEANNPYVIIGGSAGSMGFCKTEFWAADDCAYFSDNNGLDKYFLYLSLLLHAPEIKDNIRGGNIPRLDRKSIEDIRISLPNLPEQRKIASCLSLYDDIITVEKQKIEALKAHKKGLMQQLFPQPVK